MPNLIHRRHLLAGAAALAGATALPRFAMAQAGPIKIATLTPLTGAGGPYGPVMVKAVKAVVDEVNAAGGVLGRKIELISEDDQTNPEAGVRAARKLIDVDKVGAIDDRGVAPVDGDEPLSAVGSAVDGF